MSEKNLPALPPEYLPDESHLTDWQKLVAICHRELFYLFGVMEIFKYKRVIRTVEHLFDPQSPNDITIEKAMVMERYMREQLKLAPITIFNNMSVVKRLLSLAHIRKLGGPPPAFALNMPRRKMRGRPVKHSEYLQMLRHVEKTRGHLVAGKRALFLLRALWHSGLRSGELISLTWEPSNFCVDLSGKRPMFRIGSGADKSKRARLLPMAPKFAKLLMTVPKEMRTGYVCRMNATRLGQMVTRTAREVGAVTIDSDGYEIPVTPHDFRRAFCSRWSQRLPPDKLMLLMRHESYLTTARYYLDSKSEDVAEELWKMGYKKKPRAIRKPKYISENIVVDEATAEKVAEFPYVVYVPPGLF